jgi:hypothetical protein
MEASWHNGEVIVRAENEEAARELAFAHLTIAVPTRPGRDTLFSPWTQRELVACSVYEGGEYSSEGEPTILNPAVDPLN